MPKVTFLDELPSKGRPSYGWFWAALKANPGKWAEWPGAMSGAAQSAKGHSVNGCRFESQQSGGKAYIRMVADDA